MKPIVCMCVLLEVYSQNVVFSFRKYADKILKFLIKLSLPSTWQRLSLNLYFNYAILLYTYIYCSHLESILKIDIDYK